MSTSWVGGSREQPILVDSESNGEDTLNDTNPRLLDLLRARVPWAAAEGLRATRRPAILESMTKESTD
ncbi:hypothetical protein ACO22_03417 [Paracoccidioides brasiliensis]|uniref:Uncharacterized protein n=1 Tax=Paracoccidioides brasiliensis TaxID=121759 RepID=A0A1D2JFX5_PARBR|nr:hypothetical protein ACO22_03417 [Paracoccidioides brasiliensis]